MGGVAVEGRHIGASLLRRMLLRWVEFQADAAQRLHPFVSQRAIIYTPQVLRPTRGLAPPKIKAVGLNSHHFAMSPLLVMVEAVRLTSASGSVVRGIRWFVGCAALFLSALAIAPTTAARADQPPAPGIFFKITGEVECEGQRVVYDDVIEIRAAPTDGLPSITRGDIIRPLQSGAGLMMEVPSAGGLWLDLNKRRPQNPLWKDPEVVAAMLRPPPEFLPEFYWINNLTNPTVMESYIAEAYYQQPTARLKIIKPIQLVYVPPSLEARRIATDQALAEPKVDLTHGLRSGDPRWWTSFSLFAVEENVWRKVGVVAQAISAAGGQDHVLFDNRQGSALFDVAWPIYREHWANTRPYHLGVPQPEKYPRPVAREGMLYGENTGYHGDGGLPVECAGTGGLCRTLLDRKGYEIFYFDRPAPKLGFNSHVIDLLSAPAFYDRNTNKIYMVGREKF
jgi:hypothetical protein